MRIKKRSGKKTEFIGLRMSKEDKNKIMQRALLYCEGNISEFLLYAALNYEISRKDLDMKLAENHIAPKKLPQ
jgi:hypothetical protein